MGYYTHDADYLILCGARFYDPRIGRWLSRDPIGYSGGVNLYEYCGSNPVMGIDPSGFGPDDPLITRFVNWIRPAAAIESRIAGLASAVGLGTPTVFGPIVDLHDSVANFGTTVGMYDSGCATLGQVFKSGAIAGVNIIGTALTIYGAGKAATGVKVPQCFVAGTPVQMADGSYKPIERVRFGDRVFTRSEDGKVQTDQLVTHTSVKVSKHTIRVGLASSANGTPAEIIECTPEHRFYVQGAGFVQAGQLAIGNSIVTRAGPGLHVVSVEHRQHEAGVKVYNFTVRDQHTYFVGTLGAWVHNEGCTNVGEFSIIDWSGYPESLARPSGPFRLISGGEYAASRRTADAADRTYRRKFGVQKGYEVHELHPVKFGGNPTVHGNKMVLTNSAHNDVTSFWNRFAADMKKGGRRE